MPYSAFAESKKETKSTDVEVITVTGFQQKMTHASASISVIDSTQIENKAYRDITEALQDVPGIFAEDGAGIKGGSSEVSIRGLSADYSLILVNGKPQGSSQIYANGQGDGEEFGWLPPISAIERIEVIRGPMSSLYGSDALGGVINVITKRSQDKWTGEMSVETVLQDDSKAGNSEQLRYFVNGPMGSDNIILSLSGSGYQRDEDDISYGYKDTKNINNSARVDWYINDEQSLSFEGGLGTQDSLGTADKSGKLSQETERTFFGVSHDIAWGDFDTVSYFQTETVENLTQEAQYKRYTLNSQTSVPLEFGDLVVGGQYKYQQTKNPLRAYNISQLDRSEYALFAELHWRVTDDLVLTSGARFINDENYGSEVVPRIYAVYTLNDQWVLKGGVTQGYRTPDLKEGDSNWVEGGGGRRIHGADVGNSELEPEKSTNYEIALNWQAQQNWAGGITLYKTDFENAIRKNVICRESLAGAYDCIYQGQTYQRIWQYQNEDEAEIQGVESFLHYFNGSFDSMLGYTYLDSEILTGKRKGHPMSNQPKSMVNLSVSYKLWDRLNLWGKVKYRSDTLEDGEYNIPAYTITDVGTSYQFNDTFNAYVGIYNLFDEEINYDDYKRVLEGRRYALGLRAKF
ncbi:TonB-dependent receptor domain-containing protein [Vibrio mimicus]|uniref:TonB-dependent receptor domain-containing protein n=1 Tax=Vibrio mimicus TaxID=674 RepID=UPI00142E557D|nr:TonB-dependent receptor [Vibrio mimicus]